MRRNRRKNKIIRLGILAAAAVLLLAVLFLFRVHKINVYGNSRYESEEIAGGLMHSFLTKNTLYLQWEFRNGKVPENMPYLNSLSVRMKSPFEIDVNVSEKELVGCTESGTYACFDEEGIVLDITNERQSGLPVITGADIGEPVLYQKLPTQSSAQLRTILSITQLLRQQGLEAKEINFGENGDITVTVDGVKAMLGQDEYMEEKIANLRAIMEKTEGQRGTLHLESFTGKNDAATFQISDEPETESETEAETAGQEADPDTSGSAAEQSAGDPSDEQAAAGDTPEAAEDAEGEEAADPEAENADSSSVTIAMVFNSSGTLVYNVHVENGTVVDSNGTAVAGCSVDENGYIVDAYMNRFDPKTGELVQ